MGFDLLKQRPDLAELFLKGTPLLDVRAEVEFAKGSFPGATNIPILRDDEREKVGTCYKQLGQDAAMELGHQLVSGSTKEERISAWCEWFRQNPGGWLYCFRGGLRSRLTEEWMQQAGMPCPRVEGGYKAMRQYLMDVIERAASEPLLIVSGRTGTGKTHLLQKVPGRVDLEGLGGHRGSAFGRFLDEQPTQINFENSLAVDLLRLHHQDPLGWRVLEDESRILGSLNIPLTLFDAMRRAPLVVLECTLEERVATVLEDYFTSRYSEACERLGRQAGEQAFSDYLRQALDRIRKRLGPEQHGYLTSVISEGLAAFFRNGNTEGFQEFITVLLEKYYDPMYDYQLSQKTAPVLFRGDRQAVTEWVAEQQAKRRGS